MAKTFTGTVKQVQRMRNAPANRKVAAGTQGIIHAHDGRSGPFRFETDQILHYGDHVEFEVTAGGEVTNIRKRSRAQRVA